MASFMIGLIAGNLQSRTTENGAATMVLSYVFFSNDELSFSYQ